MPTVSPAKRILAQVAAELPTTSDVFTVRDLERRVVKTTYRLYGHVARCTPHRQAKAAFTLAPAIRPTSSHSSYRAALHRVLA